MAFPGNLYACGITTKNFEKTNVLSVEIKITTRHQSHRSAQSLSCKSRERASMRAWLHLLLPVPMRSWRKTASPV